jgi:phage tail sheath protein FI
MAFQISPGVNVSEVDLTTVIPSVLTTAGAFAGNFNWGPANLRRTVSSEIDLVNIFSPAGPDSNTATSFFTAASFLAYGNNLKVVRAIGANSHNATSNASTVITIAQEGSYDVSLANQNNANTYGPYIARYAGALGNSLTVSTIDAGGDFSNWEVNGINVSSYFNGAPGTSDQAAAAGGTNDEMHVIVTDSGGLFTGVKNTVLEVYQYLSKASDSINSLGNSNYYRNVIYKDSKYIYAVDPVSYSTTHTTWGNTSAENFVILNDAVTVALSRGSDDAPTTANTITAYSRFISADDTDISLVITGDANIAVQQYVIDNIANSRKDCVAFISPPSSAVINQPLNEVMNITDWNTALGRSTSYAVADCGWKYMFDKYNNVYRWVPLNGDIAGLCVYTDSVRDPWFSPAGFNRGNLKNVVKLAWNPNKTERDGLYAQGVNPVGTFPGNGTVLYGDKTLQTKPSAFDRINVRRLFIVLEKTIAQAAKYSMFEFNDEFTRAQFVALVTPFLRDVQGRRGIYDFRVVCDSTNNTPEVIDSNRFVGDIYIKPARSINYIQLNFVAVRTGVDFTEVVGKF